MTKEQEVDKKIEMLQQLKVNTYTELEKATDDCGKNFHQIRNGGLKI